MGNGAHDQAKASRLILLAAAALILLALAFAPVRSGAPPTACAKAEFEDVVDAAAAALRDLNNKNRPEFQDKLRQLKDKRGWDNDRFLKEAAPYVKDEQIEVFDEKSNDLLAKISSMGQEGSSAPAPDCSMLSDLKSQMNVLVETQTAKWSYMFEKLAKELAQ
jgi:hypothetical protein